MPRHRLLMIGLAAILAAIVAAVILLAPSGDEVSLPEPLEAVFPPPGDSVVRQTAIEVEIPVGYEIALEVDGRPVPAFEIAVSPSTGVWRWQPAPGASLERWEAGVHTVRVTWEAGVGRPDVGEFTWSFRVT